MAAFLCGALLIAGGAVFRHGADKWALLVPLALTCAGIAVRWRSPLGSLGLGTLGVVVDLFVGPSLPTLLVYTDNIYTAALYGPARFARWLLGVACCLAVLVGAVAWFLTEDWRPSAVYGVQVGLMLISPVTTAMVLRQQREQAAAERARAEQVARLAELDRQAAIAAERAAMARELHDMVANHFSAIAIQSTAVLSRKDLDSRTVRTVMESVRENSVKGMAEMRAMIGLLRQDDGSGNGGDAVRPRLADAESLVERARQAGMTVELRVEGEPRELPASVDLAGYRILQEALTNALKHGGRSAGVVLGYRAESVRVVVDNPLASGASGASGAVPGVVSAMVSAGAGAPLVSGGAGASLGDGAGAPLVGGGVAGGSGGGGSGRSGDRDDRGRRGEVWLSGAGAGLVGMRERALLVGGSCEAGVVDTLSSQVAVWRVEAVLPTGVVAS
ncbi:sensor histidine kinase [Nonomuraea montanisoli]|uniref:sensor histidine kinase n=1 Tax=Nonomuraea montanisoli TaxID=2741721 RepID=UPI002E292EE1|nr:histidine kinase [Nonomuraea montanisoli]